MAERLAYQLCEDFNAGLELFQVESTVCRYSVGVAAYRLEVVQILDERAAILSVQLYENAHAESLAVSLMSKCVVGPCR